MQQPHYQGSARRVERRKFSCHRLEDHPLTGYREWPPSRLSGDGHLGELRRAEAFRRKIVLRAPARESDPSSIDRAVGNHRRHRPGLQAGVATPPDTPDWEGCLRQQIRDTIESLPTKGSTSRGNGGISIFIPALPPFLFGSQFENPGGQPR